MWADRGDFLFLTGTPEIVIESRSWYPSYSSSGPQTTSQFDSQYRSIWKSHSPVVSITSTWRHFLLQKVAIKVLSASLFAALFSVSVHEWKIPILLTSSCLLQYVLLSNAIFCSLTFRRAVYMLLCNSRGCGALIAILMCCPILMCSQL